MEILDGHRRAVPLAEVYGYQPGWGVLDEDNAQQIIEIMSRTATRGETHRHQRVVG